MAFRSSQLAEFYVTEHIVESTVVWAHNWEDHVNLRGRWSVQCAVLLFGNCACGGNWTHSCRCLCGCCLESARLSDGQYQWVYQIIIFWCVFCSPTYNGVAFCVGTRILAVSASPCNVAINGGCGYSERTSTISNSEPGKMCGPCVRTLVQTLKTLYLECGYSSQ